MAGDQLSPALERALFVKFWAWLVVVTLVAIPVITGIATVAVQGARALLSQDIEQLKARILEVQKMSDDAAMKTAENQGRAEGAAEAAVARSNEANEQLTNLKKVAASANTAGLSVPDTQKIVASLVTNADFSSAVAALSRTQLEAFAGPRAEAFRVSSNDPNWFVSGSCPADSTLVNFYCQIDQGGGNLQNLGVHDGKFYCLWNNIGGNFRAWGQSLCLRVSKK
jgi:hypothetical protein